MSFENKVLTSINELLTPGDQARFTHGKLFVRCTENTATTVLGRLESEFKDAKVTLNKWVTQTEFTFYFA
jgi:hypothetical protein